MVHARIRDRRLIEAIVDDDAIACGDGP